MITNKQEYYKEIEDLAHDIWSEALDQADNDEDEAYGLINGLVSEVVDGHQWITHSRYHDQVICYSVNKDAYLLQHDDKFLGDLVRDYGIKGLHSELACIAMREDVTNSIYKFLA